MFRLIYKPEADSDISRLLVFIPVSKVGTYGKNVKISSYSVTTIAGRDPNLDQDESALVRLPGCRLKTDAYPKHTDEQLFDLSPVYSN